MIFEFLYQTGSYFIVYSFSILGYDIFGHAETGSGKTAAFILPIIDSIMKSTEKKNTHCAPIALVLAPTRELISQLYNQTRKLAAGNCQMKLFSSRDISSIVTKFYLSANCLR